MLPAVRRGLPQARFALEDRRAVVAALARDGVAGAGAAAAALGARAGGGRRRRRPRPRPRDACAARSAAVWHAVEHKSIAAYEAGGADEVANAAAHAKEHDRCGSNLVVPLLGHDDDRQHRRAASCFGRRALGGRTVVAALSIGAAVEVFAFSARRPEHPRLAGHPRHGPRDAVGLRHARAEPGRPARRPGRDGGPAARRGGRRPRLTAAAAMSVSVTVVAPATAGGGLGALDRLRPLAASGTRPASGPALDGPLAPGSRLELHLRHPRGRDFYTRPRLTVGRAGAARSSGRRGASACGRRPARR